MKNTKKNTLPSAAPALLRAAGDLLPAMARAGQEYAAKLNLPFDASVNAQIVSQPGNFGMSINFSMRAVPPAPPSPPSSSASLPPPSVSQDSSKTYGKGYKEGFEQGYRKGHEDGLEEAGGDADDYDRHEDDIYDPDGVYRDEEERAEAEWYHYNRMSERLSQ